MTYSSLPLVKWRLAQLAAHLVVALVALVVIGGATRVMEAGLACPDWPLCFGSLLPGSRMNLQVFLEWFHRLDAFVVALALVAQFCLAWVWRSHLPTWLPRTYLSLVFLVMLQAGFGALTVLQLLPSGVVTTHFGIALLLLAVMSALAQRLLSPNQIMPPIWWQVGGGSALIAVMAQSLLGARMASSWSVQICFSKGQACGWFDLHRISAIPVTLIILTFVVTSFFVGGWPRQQWRYLLTLSLLVLAQVSLGIMSVHFALSQPLLTVGHQLVAALLVAFLSALTFKSSQTFEVSASAVNDQFLMET